MQLNEVLASVDVDLDHGTVRRTVTGRLYGAPTTQRSFQASFYDCVRIDDGRIIERVQQTDMLAQMRQLYGKALGLVELDAMFLRLWPRTPLPKPKPGAHLDRSGPEAWPSNRLGGRTQAIGGWAE